MPSNPHQHGSEIRTGTMIRTVLGATLIATLGVLWVFQSLTHQRLQDEITLCVSNSMRLERLILVDRQEIDALLARPALIQQIQHFGLRLGNISFNQIIHVTNAVTTGASEMARSRAEPPIAPMAAAILRQP